VELWEVLVRYCFFVIAAIGASAVKQQRDTSASRIALLEYSQRLEREIIGISEREQERIGQDLHDSICQSLAALSCGAALLKGDLDEHGLAAEAKVADELAGFLRELANQTRNLARGLAPVQMDESGLSSALEELAASSSRLLGIGCTYEFSGSPVIRDNVVAMHLYRIAQEAINNATKHGEATDIAIFLGENGRSTTLRIADNGKGISGVESKSTGMGLGLMKHRARLAGGELSIEAPPNGGTIVSCGILLPPEEWSQHAA
jgi:signal transduction histidine kinase